MVREENATTRSIPLKDIVLPENARTHSPEDLELLAQDMKRNGQLQEIIVTPLRPDASTPPQFVVVSGVGRTLAARSLGWTEIRASVRENLSDFDRLHITFSENEAQEEVSPLYQAALIADMLKNKKITQDELAQQLGINQQRVSDYLTLSRLGWSDKDFTDRSVKLGIAHFLSISRIKDNSKLRLKMAQKAIEKGWSVRELDAEIDKLLAKPKAGQEGVFSGLRDYQDRQAKNKEAADNADPLEGLWPGMKADKELKDISWKVEYVDREWVFHITNPPKQKNPERILAQWADRLNAFLEPFRREEQERRTKETPVDGPIWLPKSPAEIAELEALSKKGPYDVYARLYGEDSPVALRFKGATWDVLIPGIDPIQAVRELLKELKPDS